MIYKFQRGARVLRLISKAAPRQITKLQKSIPTLFDDGYLGSGIKTASQTPVKWRWIPQSNAYYKDNVIYSRLFPSRSSIGHEFGHHVSFNFPGLQKDNVLGAFTKGYEYSPGAEPERNYAENFADWFKTAVKMPYIGEDPNLTQRQIVIDKGFGDTQFFSTVRPDGRLYMRYEPTYKSVKRSGMESPVRSGPIMDILRLQIPSFKTGDLGRGHYYRTIGNKVENIKDGIVAKNPAYNEGYGVHWAEEEPLREYTGNSALMVRYDAKGPYQFQVGNFGNPTSSASNPIMLEDPYVTLYGRYPFMSKYHFIPKTEEGFKHANKLGKMNRFIEQPTKWAVRGGVGYYLYDKYIRDDSKEKE